MQKEQKAAVWCNPAYLWKSSLSQLSHLNVVVFCGMMGALAIVLEYVGSIRIGAYARIGITELPNVTVDFLFGPAVGVIFAAVMDVLKFVADPDGMFFPGYMLTAVTAAFIFGCFLYRQKVSLRRLFLAECLVKLICNLGLNTLWAVVLYHKAIMVILPTRLVTNAIQLPLDTIVIYLLLQTLNRTIRGKFQP